MARDRSFENARAAALARLARARSSGQADPRAAGAVDALNHAPGWYTTSSCSGRVQALALPAPGAKDRARVLGRWHGAPPPEALARALAPDARPAGLGAHLFVEPPILHVAARGLAEARALLRLAQGAGFKASHVRSLASSGRVTVEVGSTERVAAPVAGPGGAVPQGFLDLLAGEAPALLARGHARLDALARAAALLPAAPPAAPPTPSPGRAPAGRFKAPRKEAN